MRASLPRHYRISLVGVLFGATAAFGCDAVPAGQPLWIRLAAPVSTYTAKPGDAVGGILTQQVTCGSEVVLPMGTPVEGFVRSRHKVGWGLRHETASLELEFTRAILEGGMTVPLAARVAEVENARETVRNGVIEGIRSSKTFQGGINSRLVELPTWNPYSHLVLTTYKALFPIFPEPEIYYPAGTDMRLKTERPIVLPARIRDADFKQSATLEQDSDENEAMVAHLPVRVTTKKNVDADLVNLVFEGTEPQVRAAFQEAGWRTADRPAVSSFMKYLYAVLNNSGYAQQPMTTFLMDGKPEQMNWQKNLNSYGRRDHVRIWQWQRVGADPVWVASSTRDTRAVISLRHVEFAHHIAPAIDEERASVIRDLNFAGCVKQVSYVERPEMPLATMNATGDVMHTDGSVAVVKLQDCRPREPQLDSTTNARKFKPGNIVFRYVRKEILTLRNDLWRENIIYGTYEVGRLAVTSIRNRTDARLRESLEADARVATPPQPATAGGSR